MNQRIENIGFNAFFLLTFFRSLIIIDDMITSNRLYSKNQTGREMHRLIREYSPDMRNVYVFRENHRPLPVLSLSINAFFDIVRRIPYRRDNPPIEVIGRPGIIAENASMGMDCKKKAVLISSWMRERGIPYRLIASSRKKNRQFHHVFPQVYISGKWKNFDATYGCYRPYEKKTVTNAEVI